MKNKHSGKSLDFSAICDKIASKHNISPTKVRKEMQIALDAAWDNPDEAVRKKQHELFPSGKPTVEEFIYRIFELAKGK